MAPSGMTNASLAGVCAAFAGICAKFALSPENPQVLVRILDPYIPQCYVMKLSSIPLHRCSKLHFFFFSQNSWMIRGFFALATLTFNSLMLTLTAKALQLCPTTVQSVVTTSAVNFLVTVKHSYLTTMFAQFNNYFLKIYNRESQGRFSLENMLVSLELLE